MQKTSDWLLSFNSLQKNSLEQNGTSSKLKMAKTISITGGKGGVGKTSVALKLAKEFSQRGLKVLLIDCDYNLSNTAIKLGLPVSNTFYDLLSSYKNFDECIIKNGNFHLLSACNGSLSLFDADFRFEQIIVDIIGEHGRDYDYILLDCPAGLGRESLILNAYCNDRIVVVTPDKSSITDSYSLIKILNHRYGVKENHLLVNMYATDGQYHKVVRTLSETIENFIGTRTHLLGGIKKVNVEHSRFDHFFLDDHQNEIHRSFIKVVDQYTEQQKVTSGLQHAQQSVGMSYEQEVR